MAQNFAKPWIKTSVNVSPEFYKLSRQHLIKFSEALRVGISILLAEKGVIPYDNRLNIVRLSDYYKKEAAMYAQKAADLENTKKEDVIENEETKEV